MHQTLDELLAINESGDSEKFSFHIKNNLERFQAEYPFFHESLDVGRAIERLLKAEKDETMILYAIEKVGSADRSKYAKRNYALILADLYLEENNASGIETIISDILADELKFQGYRKLLVYYAENYNEKKFLAAFKKIEKRNTLMPEDRDAISQFIEKYASSCDNINDAKEFIRKKKIYTKTEDYIIPITVGHFQNRLNFDALETFVFEEMSDNYKRFFYAEEVYNKLYKRSKEKKHQLLLLSKLERLAERTPKDLKVKGYPGKLWSLTYWRIGCKYLELNEKGKTESIVALLKGKNKQSLQMLLKEKYGEN